MRFSLLGVIPFIIHLGLLVSTQGSSAPQNLDRESERHFVRGVQFQQQGDLQNARLAYEAALKSAPRRVDVLSNLGSVFAQLNDYDKAIQHYRKALAVNPALYQVRYHLGAAYALAQDTVNARLTLGKLLDRQQTFEGADDARRILASVK